jgi:glycyl-tRNA synthetase beta chain
MTDTLLIELLTEELPPKALRRLAEDFSRNVIEGLVRARLRTRDAAEPEWFATPRRLAVSIPAVAARAPDEEVTEKVMPVKVAFDAGGRPTPALRKKLAAKGIPESAVSGFERRPDGKTETLFHRMVVKGAVLDDCLATIMGETLRKLPAPKLMRWGSGDAQFVRPVHGLVMMHGARIVPGEVLGVRSSNQTLGHRFLSTGPILLAHAGHYERILRDQGGIIASFGTRRAEIERLLADAAGDATTIAGDDELLDEVTALVEAPAVYEGRFDAGFLQVPQECLVLSMKQHQRYFPLLDRQTSRLLPRFLLVANLRADDPSNIIRGNERVLRARLSDAKFFYDQDRRLRLEERVPQLANVVYHNRLGSQLERVERVQLLAGRVARQLGVDALLAERAAWLSKADLLTGMVGEFPELQGTMGRYYALNDGEPEEVADAIEAHYRPRFAGDELPAGGAACALALADKLEALAGMFGIGQQPTGDKDPFALRRHALGIVRILIERKLPLALSALAGAAYAVLGRVPGLKDTRSELETFILERLRGHCLEQGYTANEVEAVLCLRPDRIDLVPKQLEAVRAFAGLPESQSLVAANKRIANILKQADEVPVGFDENLLVQPEEKALALAFTRIHPGLEEAFEALDYTRALRNMASLKEPVDAFFDKVMVMDSDLRLRANRVGFLGRLHAAMNRIADLSRLMIGDQ